MASDSSSPRRLFRRRNLLAAGPPALGAVAAALLLGGGGASASPTAGSTSYSALLSTAPSGLPLVTSHHFRQPGDPEGPSWPAEAPEGAAERGPVSSSIRRVELSVPRLSAWIARSGAGGICVLLYDGAPVNGVSAVDASCSLPERLDRGASVEVFDTPGMPGKVIAAGVVPDGVTAVTWTMADGSSYTAPVRDNAWARVTDQPAATGEEPTLTEEG
jgi:hypothetical protein